MIYLLCTYVACYSWDFIYFFLTGIWTNNNRIVIDFLSNHVFMTGKGYFINLITISILFSYFIW